MNCAVCKRPLFEGATACIVCGAPVGAQQAAPSPSGYGPPPPQAPPIVDAYAPSNVPSHAQTAPFAQTAPYAQAAPYAQPAPHPQPLPQAQYAPGYGAGVPPPPPIAGYPPPTPYYAPAPQIADRNNSLAVASFICGILGLVPFWIGFILCIVAIVLGGFAIAHANRLPDRRGKGLAIAGLVLGICFILPASCGL
jgi:Domain of unknown function (DUF4190)